MCLALIFLNTIVKKTYPEPRNYLQFHDPKAPFKVPKICNIKYFWIENDTTPALWHYSENSSDLVPLASLWTAPFIISININIKINIAVNITITINININPCCRQGQTMIGLESSPYLQGDF